MRQRGDERGVRHRGGVQTHLVGAGVDRGGRIALGADAAADRERDEQLARHGANGVGERATPFEGRRDVEDDQLVDELAVVATGELGRIARAAKPFEVDAL